MALEIERKFLVTGNGWRTSDPEPIRQGYLNLDPQRTVRVRITDSAAFITVKGPSIGIARAEFEYPIPMDDAAAMLAMCGGATVEKRRHRIAIDATLAWEVDEFLGGNQGLVVAEIELADESQPFPRPAWLGREVTRDARYLNASLARNPYNRWAQH